MIGENLKTARTRANKTQEELAQALGTTQNTVWRWEKGHVAPDDGKKIEIAELLGTTVSYLVGETEDISPVETGEFNLVIKDIARGNPNLMDMFKGENWRNVSEQQKKVIVDGMRFVFEQAALYNKFRDVEGNV